MGRGIGRENRVVAGGLQARSVGGGNSLREPLDLADSLTDVVFKMSEGNPGAVNVLSQILNKDQMAGMMNILSLDDMNMRGPQIWVGYKDHCGEDIDTFINKIRGRDLQMLKAVNEQCSSDGETAVPHGGSERTKQWFE
jgi:hypothetical protein